MALDTARSIGQGLRRVPTPRRVESFLMGDEDQRKHLFAQQAKDAGALLRPAAFGGAAGSTGRVYDLGDADPAPPPDEWLDPAPRSRTSSFHSPASGGVSPMLRPAPVPSDLPPGLDGYELAERGAAGASARMPLMRRASGEFRSGIPSDLAAARAPREPSVPRRPVGSGSGAAPERPPSQERRPSGPPAWPAQGESRASGPFGRSSGEGRPRASGESERRRNRLTKNPPKKPRK